MLNLPFFKKESTGRFVPCKGNFSELIDDIEDSSINGISRHLGYHPDQVHSYLGRFDDKYINAVVFEIFTDRIVFILTKKNIRALKNSMVLGFLRDFNIKKEYDDLTKRDILKRGIENKSLNINYLSNVLDIEDPQPDGIIYIEKLGLNLFFIDGLLVDFQSSDGLNEWAKYFKQLNPRLFDDYVRRAKMYWGSNLSKIINEVNNEFRALSCIPGGVTNQYIELHRNSYGTINFHMLMVCHYGASITAGQFEELNYGRYTKLSNRVYKLDNFRYEFDKNGELADWHLV